MKVLVAFAALCACGSAVDCNGINAFQPSLTYARGSTVIHNGQVYAASMNVGALHDPQGSASWIPIGACGQVRGGARSAGTGGVDCSGVAEYKAKIYSQPGMQAYYEGSLYRTKWYAGDADIPGKEGSSPWELLGECADGTMGEVAESVGPEVDCSDATAYKAKIYPDPNTKVYYNEILYHNGYYASATDLPGESAPWTADGKCKVGTMGEGSVTLVDCTGIPAWSGSVAYTGENSFSVHSDGNLFTNKYWNQGTKPSADDADGPWAYKGRCEEGTDSTPAVADPNEVTPEKAKLLCTCCKGCASLNVLGPQCLDDVPSEETCYHTWCPNVGSAFDQEECQHIKNTHQLQYYTGEIPEGQKEWPKHVFVPYIDGGLAEQPPVDELVDTLGVKYFVIAFAQTGAYNTTVGCQAALASAIPIKEGPTSWNATKGGNDMFWERVANLRRKGGDITLSFGGYNGIELADHDKCTKGPDGKLLPESQIVENLKNAYKEAVDFLKLTHIDFDIEGNAYSKVQREKGWQYRFKAVKALKAEYPYLKVWWTLPILPSGLTEDGALFVGDLFASGAPADKLNMMTMDYGDDTVCLGNDMHACEVSAMDSLASQVLQLATANNVASQFGFTTKESVYPFIGSTPMIGTNDFVNEIYSLDNAKDSLNVWKTTDRKLGVISMWSLTRDHPCDHSYVDPLCTSSNNQESDYQFTKIFAEWTGYEA